MVFRETGINGLPNIFDDMRLVSVMITIDLTATTDDRLEPMAVKVPRCLYLVAKFHKIILPGTAKETEMFSLNNWPRALLDNDPLHIGSASDFPGEKLSSIEY